jgi:hypothetical protein
MPTVEYQLLSVKDLERLLPFAAQGHRMSDVLHTRLASNRRVYFLDADLLDLARAHGVPSCNRLLEAARTRFWAAVAPGFTSPPDLPLQFNTDVG